MSFNHLIASWQNVYMAKETTMHVVVPAELKKEFKAACVLDGVNMSQIVCELIQDWVTKRKQSNEPQPE